jgi:hypothetical protein
MTNLSAATNLRDARAPGEIAADADAPTKAEPGYERAHGVRLTVAKLQDRCGAWAQKTRQFGNQAANALKAVAPTIQRKTRLGGNGDLREVSRNWLALCTALETDRAARRIHLVARHIREVGEEEIKVRGIAWGARSEEWFGEIAVQEGDARSNAGA